jgi:hypothetical protein
MVFVDSFDIRGRVNKMAIYSLPDPEDAPGTKPKAASPTPPPAAADE